MGPEDYLLKLLKIKSDKEADKKPIIKTTIQELKKQGYKIKILNKKNPVLLALGNNNNLLFQGHLDTVPFGEGWKTNPLGTIKKKRICGRGSADMKGGIAALLAALEKTKKHPLIILTTDEEFGSFLGILTGIKYLKDNNLKPKLGLNMEPTKLNICIGRKGVLNLKIQVKGKAAHGSVPEKGDNAIVKAAKIIQALTYYCPKLKEYANELGETTLNIGRISGGTASNVVPDQTKIIIDIRPVNVKPEKIISEIKKEIGKVGINKEDYQIIKRTGYGAYLLDKNSKIIQKLRKITGKETITRTGFAETYFLIKAGIPAVSLGPDYQTIHQVDEYVTINDLKECSKIYQKICEEF